ncbi:hypothetical protein ACQPU1_08640 [Clostridium paraputrificum]
MPAIVTIIEPNITKEENEANLEEIKKVLAEIAMKEYNCKSVHVNIHKKD